MSVIRYDFIWHPTTGMYETIGCEFGIAASEDLWASAIGAHVHRRERDGTIKRSCGEHVCGGTCLRKIIGERMGRHTGKNRPCCSCWCVYRKIERNLFSGHLASTEAYYIDVEGLSSLGKGRDVLRKLVVLGDETQPAFAGPALRVVVSFIWNRIGKYYFGAKSILYMLYLYLQTHSAIESNYNTYESLVISIAILFLVALSMLEILVELIASLRDGCQTACRALQADPLNMLEFASAIASGTANVMVIVVYSHDGDVSERFKDWFAGFMSLASLLGWLRIFDLVRGQPQLGFYSQLILKSLYDVRFFFVLLVMSVAAFASAAVPLIEVADDDPDTPLERFLSTMFWHSTVEDSVNPLDEGNYSAKHRIKWLYNVLMCIFILLIPIIMLNMLISILGKT